MKKRLLLPLIPAAATLALASPALAATSETASENWAGYEATTSSGSGFDAVSGGWTQPSVNCSSGQTTYSAYWVGLGGGDENSDALEQVGTQADCNGNTGTASYYAWYELVPKAPVRIGMAVHAGDKLWARTAVSGDQVSVYITDETTGKTFSKTLTMARPDTSTAEWVAEAPSTCTGTSSGVATGSCTPLTLSDFGSVRFTDAHARSNGQVGSVSSYDTTAIELQTSSSSLYGGYGGGMFSGYDSASAAGSEGAAPGALSADGTGFTVTYGAQFDAETSTGGYGSSSGDGSATSGGGDSAYGYAGSGYGYPGGGYGDSGDGASGQADPGSSYGYSSGYGDSGYGYSGGEAGGYTLYLYGF